MITTALALVVTTTFTAGIDITFTPLATMEQVRPDAFRDADGTLLVLQRPHATPERFAADCVEPGELHRREDGMLICAQALDQGSPRRWMLIFAIPIAVDGDLLLLSTMGTFDEGDDAAARALGERLGRLLAEQISFTPSSGPGTLIFAAPSPSTTPRRPALASSAAGPAHEHLTSARAKGWAKHLAGKAIILGGNMGWDGDESSGPGGWREINSTNGTTDEELHLCPDGRAGYRRKSETYVNLGSYGSVVDNQDTGLVVGTWRLVESGDKLLIVMDRGGERVYEATIGVTIDIAPPVFMDPAFLAQVPADKRREIEEKTAPYLAQLELLRYGPAPNDTRIKINNADKRLVETTACD